MTTDDLRRLHAYNRWATMRLLDAGGSLPPALHWQHLGGSFGTLIGTFQHIVGADWVWLERFRGRSPRTFEGIDTLTTLEAIRARWEDVAAGLEGFVAGLGEESLQAPVAYTSFKGDAFSQPLGSLLQHVVNHGTYHRGQAAMMLRQLGAAVPSTDLSAFTRLDT